MESEKATEKRNTVKGVRIRGIYIVMVIIAAVIAAWLIVTNFQSLDSYNKLSSAAQHYIAGREDAYDLINASDYLTEQVRAFASTGDRQYLDHYFTEINETRRRDRAVEGFRSDLEGLEAYGYLEEALSQSTVLEQIEYRSMVLMILAEGLDLSEFPEVLQTVELSEEELAMTRKEQADRSLELLYDETYVSYKDDIRNNVQACSDELVRIITAEGDLSSTQLQKILLWQTGLTTALLIIVFLILLLTSILVIRPIRRCIARIKDQQMLPDEGSREIRFLSSTYNTMFQEVQKNHEQLSYEASHDALTGLYNRKVFDKQQESWGGNPENIALILIDVDHFKTLNDTYGHSVGDAVLKKVAEILSRSFRSEDYVCRTGGDEFAVIMVNASSELKGLVAGKLDRALDKLRNPDDGLPVVTLSIGVAFSDRENPTDSIYNDADTACYRVKDRGKNGYAFY